MAEFTMPTLGADMEEGTLVEWRVKPGDPIHKGDIIAVVDTAKSAIEVESFHTGTVGTLVAEVGDTVPVGTVLATITEEGPGGGAPEAEAGAVPEAAAGAVPEAEAGGVPEAGAGGVPEAGAGAAPEAGAGAAPAGRARVTPLVRRAAERLGVDLAHVRGTGRAGAITRADVEAAAAEPGAPAAAAPGSAARGDGGRTAAPPGQGRAGTTGKATGGARPRVSPLARRVAAELGMDPAGVPGTGPGGAVRADDVRRAAREGGAAARSGAGPTRPGGPAQADRTQRSLAMRQVIARLMARSKREIPHYYLSNTVDMGAAMAWLKERNLRLSMSERLVPAALLLKASALAAREVSGLNGYWVDDRFEPAPAIHVGVAISLRGGGLVTPALHDADTLPLGELMGLLRDLVNRARAGRLRRTELTDATITVTNLGDQGVESVTGVIFPPQVALVGFGKVVERPWALGGLLGVRPVAVTTLAADHRATDGYTGARYLAAVADLLQRPEEL